MVFVGGRSEEEREDSKTEDKRFTMAMGTEKSRNLHNFSLPCLKWGGQRHLRCVKVHDDDDDAGGRGRRFPPTSSKTYHDFGGLTRKRPEPDRKGRSFFEAENFRRSSSRFQTTAVAAPTEIRRRPAIDSDVDDGIEAVRKRLMLDLQTEMDKIKSAVLSEGSEENAPPPPTKTVAPVEAEARPWNLRTRRAVCKEPNANGGGGGRKSQRVDEGNSSYSPARGAMKSPATRSDVGVGGGGIKKPRSKFSVPLSKQEIEEDFVAITGARPPRKPKKRPRHVQQQMDTLFPGLWLSEITADMYKVNENPDDGKR